jgi:hypothetical protein
MYVQKPTSHTGQNLPFMEQINLFTFLEVRKDLVKIVKDPEFHLALER